MLLRLIEQKQLVPHIDVEAPWTDVAKIAQALVDRKYPGKAVLKVR